MRSLATGIALVLAICALAQPSWLPLSREVERVHLPALYELGSTAHTSIRPYRRDLLWHAHEADTLRPKAAWATLDRWAGVRNGRKVRWGPLLDASGGVEPGVTTRPVYRAGAGLWLDADLHEKLSFHFNGQAWDQRFPTYLDTLVQATQVAPGEGFAFGDGPNYSHYDFNGHLSWDPGKYFNLTVGRGRNFFGEGHRSLMLSDEAYAYPYLRITTKVWRVQYVNLFTAMSDIRGAGGDPTRFDRKYTSIHYLSWNVSKRVNLNVFEAIIWSAGDSIYPRGFDVNYLNPIIFYRPVEYSVGSPDNAMVGMGLNVKVGKNVLLYSQFVLDELIVSEVREGTGWFGNKQSLQLGVLARDAFAVKDLVLRGEWNVVRPFMYTHSESTQNHAHFGQPLAHPYGSNLQEVIMHADRTAGRWHYGLRASMAWMGSDTEFSFGNNIFRPERERPVLPNGNLRDRGYTIGSAQQIELFHGQLRGGYLLDPSTATRLEVSYLFRNRSGDGIDTDQLHVLRVGLVCHFRQRYHEQEVRYVLP